MRAPRMAKCRTPPIVPAMPEPAYAAEARHTAFRAPEPNFVLAVALMILASVFFAGMAGLIRYGSQDLHPFQLAFLRSAFGILFMLPWLMKAGVGILKTSRIGLISIRGLMAASAMFAFFWALSVMPLAEAVALSFTAPFFVTILAVVFLQRSCAGAALDGCRGRLCRRHDHPAAGRRDGRLAGAGGSVLGPDDGRLHHLHQEAVPDRAGQCNLPVDGDLSGADHVCPGPVRVAASDLGTIGRRRRDRFCRHCRPSADDPGVRHGRNDGPDAVRFRPADLFGRSSAISFSVRRQTSGPGSAPRSSPRPASTSPAAKPAPNGHTGHRRPRESPLSAERRRTGGGNLRGGAAPDTFGRIVGVPAPQ